MPKPYVWAEIRDISAYVSPLESYVMAPAVVGESVQMKGCFVDIYGYAVGEGADYAWSYVAEANQVFTWHDVWAAAFSTTTLPDKVVGVRFDHDKNLCYTNKPPEGAMPPLLVVRNGPTWEAMKNRAVGRNG